MISPYVRKTTSLLPKKTENAFVVGMRSVEEYLGPEVLEL